MVDGQSFMTCLLFGFDTAITSTVAARLAALFRHLGGAGGASSGGRGASHTAYAQYVDDYDAAAFDVDLLYADESMRAFDHYHRAAGGASVKSGRYL